MDRRTFVIEAGKAFPVVVGAVYVFGCSSSNPASPSNVADVLSTSTTSAVTGTHQHDFTFQGKK
jgi:hypothetical protein